MALFLLLPACDKVPLLAPSGSTITLFAAQSVLPVNGWTDIVATVVEAAGTPVQNGTLVTFSTTVGTIEPSEARTSNGKVTVRFNSGGQSGTAEIRAFSGGASTEEPLTIDIGAAVVDSVQLSATPGTVPSTGGTVQLTATVIDKNGNPLPRVPVGFSTTVGTLSASTANTDDNGQARVSLTTTREAVVTARVGTKTETFTVRVNAVPTISITPATQTVVVSQPAAFSLAPPSTPVPGALTNVRIDFGDGSSRDLGNITGSTAVTHPYCSPTGYTVQATGTDINGERASSSAAVTVTPLGVTITSSGSPRTGQPVVFTATPSSPSAILSRFEWDFGDFQQQTTFSPTVAHTYQSARGYEVKLTAFGQTCGVATAQTGIVITP